MNELDDRRARGPSPRPSRPSRKRNGTSIRSKKIDEQREVLGHAARRARRSRPAPNQKKNSRGRSHSLQRRPQPRCAKNSSVASSDQEQVQPVDAELVVDAELADPRLVGDVLQAAGRPLKSNERARSRARARQRAEERRAARVAAPGSSRPTSADGEREPEQDREVDGHALWSRK